MPDMFGNPTPIEVMQRLTQERDQLMQSGGNNPNGQRLANLAVLGKTAMVDPRLQHAQDIQDALKKSMDLSRNEGESSLDFEIRRGRQAFEDLKHVDPTTAAEINAQVIKMETEALERTRLQNAETRAEAQEQRAVKAETRQENIDKARNINDGLFYRVNVESGEVYPETVYTQDPDFDQKIAKFRAENNPDVVLMPADQVRAFRLNTRPADLKLLGSDQSAQEGVLTSAIAAANLANRMSQLFVDAKKEAGSNPTTYFDKLAGKIQPLVEAASELSRVTGHGTAPTADSSAFNEDLINAQKWLQERGIRSGVPAALMVRMAYTWASAFDHRVSDADFRAAYDMLSGGSGNPSQIVAALREQTFGNLKDKVDTVGVIAQNLLTENESNPNSVGIKQAHLLQSLQSKLKEATDKFDSTSSELLGLYGAKDRYLKPGQSSGPKKITADGGRTFTISSGENQ